MGYYCNSQSLKIPNYSPKYIYILKFHIIIDKSVLTKKFGYPILAFAYPPPLKLNVQSAFWVWY